MAFRRPLIISNVKDLKLNYDNAGVQAFFKDLLKELNKRPMGALLIKQIDLDGLAGTYDSELQTDCITLNANDAFYNEKTHYLTVTDDGALTLIHEGSHFMHLCIDKGKYTNPLYKNCVPFDFANCANTIDAFNEKTQRTNRYMLEFEAGYRAVCAAIMYDTNLEDYVMGDNLRNLLTITGNTPPELQVLGELARQEDINYALYNTINELSLSICKEATTDHAFTDFENAAEFKLEVTPKQKILVLMLSQLISEYNDKSESEED